ncbi:hypothetical protein ATCC90586_004886 [Pythium insidiosum]|nr:hypothetical protein ATCC90586_004886 [Pythium insidiosum]
MTAVFRSHPRITMFLQPFYDFPLRDEPPSKRTRVDKETALIVNAAHATNDVPRTYEEAINCDESDKWNAAIDKEFAAHERNKTWTIVKRLPGMKTIGTKWVIDKKWKGLELIYKAHLVALGCRQLLGVDFFDTYAAVANINSIRLVLAICCAAGVKAAIKKRFQIKDLGAVRHLLGMEINQLKLVRPRTRAIPV